MARNKISGIHILRIAVGMTLILLLIGGAGASTQVSSCTLISSPGTYVLTQNIINKTASVCINITSSNVVLDGAGYTIDGVAVDIGSGVRTYRYNKVKDVTIKNLKITNWLVAIEYNSASNGKIENNTASSNGLGIVLDESSNNILINNTLTNNKAGGYGAGIYIGFSSDIILTNNTASYNDYGIRLDSSNNTLSGNNASNNWLYGIFLGSSSSNTIYNNYFNITDNVFNDANNIWNIPKTQART